MDVGARLKALRTKKDLTQEQVSKRMGIAKQTLFKYESGIITNIPSDKIEELAKIYDTTPAFIMGWNENITPTKKEQRLAEKYLAFKNSPDPRDKAIADAVEKLLGLHE